MVGETLDLVQKNSSEVTAFEMETKGVKEAGNKGSYSVKGEGA